MRRNSVIRFDREGSVIDVAYDLEPGEIDSMAGVEYHNGILIPGMVNAHCHLELSFFKGVIPQHTGLVQFIRHVTSERGKYTRDEQIERALEEDLFMWREGVQAVGDISNDTTSFPAKVRALAEGKMRYHTFAEYFGMPEDTDEAARAFYENMIGGVLAKGEEQGLTITPTPHSTYLMSDRLLKLGAESPRVSIHFMETPSELGLYRKEGGMYEFMIEGGMIPDFFQYGSHPERLVKSLPRDIPMILIHCTQMKRADLDVILNYFTDVTFVLCPRSNYYIEAAYPPAEMFYEAGARVGLGTDSLSSNTSLSMVEEIKWLAANNPAIPLETILEWSTIGGAKGLGMEREIGTFEAGKKPGAVLLTGIDFDTMRPTPKTKAIRLL